MLENTNKKLNILIYSAYDLPDRVGPLDKTNKIINVIS